MQRSHCSHEEGVEIQKGDGSTRCDCSRVQIGSKEKEMTQQWATKQKIIHFMLIILNIYFV